MKERSHSHELTIDAPVDDVWRAITDPVELARWFPMEAAIDDGVIHYRWPPDFDMASRIDLWEPGRRLRTGWAEGMAPAGVPDDDWRRMAVDWILEGRGGRTALRLVHSGFGEGRGWDDEFDGTRRGWAFELAALRVYLERHRGQDRHARWVRRASAVDPAVGWPRLAGALELQVDGGRVSFTLGERLQGELLLDAPGKEAGGTADRLGGGVWRAGFEAWNGQGVAHLWLTRWGEPKDLDTMAARAEALLARLFPS